MDTIVVIDATPNIEDVYRDQADRLWRSLYAFAGNADIASDALAEAYAQVLRRGSAVRDPGAWTWRAAFRIAAGALRAARSRAGSESQASGYVDRYADPDLMAALQQLPNGQRAAVILFYFADMPVNDIADRLGSNSRAVRANLSRGRRRLRQLLGDDDE
jgi:RNA polymerase sigma-70 factor (ECF subfamily)